MPRKKPTPNTTVTNDVHGKPIEWTGGVSDDADEGRLYAFFSAQDGTVIEALQVLMQEPSGWLRIVPQDLGTRVHYKWKWSSGKYRGSYVYWCDNTGDISAALWGLIKKIRMVQSGAMRPTPDQPYE